MTFRRFIEDLGPLLFAIVITVAMAFYVAQLSSKENEDLLKDFATFSLGISTALAGILLTIFTIVHSINTKRMILLRNNNLYSRLISFLNSSIASHGVVIFLSLLIILPILKSTRFNLPMNQYSFSISLWMIYAFATFLSFGLSYRFISIFLHTLSDETNFSTK
jgi:hypothetical protein